MKRSILLILFLLVGCGQSAPDKPVQANSSTATTPEKDTVRKPASTRFTQTPEEKKYLENVNAYRFDQFINANNPDVKKLKLILPKELDDRENRKMYDEGFRIAMYFAKQIKLADGQTLFHFLTTCSKDVSSNNQGQFGLDEQTQKPFLHLQYFPMLRRMDGSGLEMNIIFKRMGDELVAQSPGFSSTILTDKNFMQRHGVTCWK